MTESGETAARAETDLDAAAAWAKKHWRLVTVIAMAVLLAIACRQMHFSPDSVHYVDVARTLLSDHVIGTWHLTPDSQRAPDTLMFWPPGYPLALAIFLGIGLSAGMAAWAVSVVGYTVSAWLLACWQKRPALAIAGVLAFIHLMFLAGTPFRVWSEAVYVPLMLGALVCVTAAVAATSARRATWMGLLGGALAGGAMLARYAGVAIAPALAGVVLMAPDSEDEPEGARRNALLASLGGMAAVVLPWLVRNVMVNGRLLGPARPPNERPLSEILFFTGASIYYDLGAMLLALLFGFVGYHLVNRSETVEGRREWVFSGGLAFGALVCALSQIALIVLTYLLFQIGEPPTRRYFFPAYTCILLAGLAILSRADLPERVLTRRWGPVLAMAAPIVIGPIFAASAARDVTPRETQLDAWMEQNTGSNDLIIAERAWPIRFHTGRPVLESETAPGITSVTDGRAVAEALERFGDEVGDVYVVPEGEAEEKEILSSYRAAGLTVEEVATVKTAPHDYRKSGEQERKVYRVERP